MPKPSEFRYPCPRCKDLVTSAGWCRNCKAFDYACSPQTKMSLNVVMANIQRRARAFDLDNRFELAFEWFPGRRGQLCWRAYVKTDNIVRAASQGEHDNPQSALDELEESFVPSMPRRGLVRGRDE